MRSAAIISIFALAQAGLTPFGQSKKKLRGFDFLHQAIGDKTPQQFHIALAGLGDDGEATGMSVNWHTTKQTADSVCEYGPDASMQFKAEGTSKTYIGESAEHNVVLPDLTQGQSYFYRCGGDGVWGPSRQFVFRSAADKVQYPVTVAIFGDMGIRSQKAAPSIDMMNRLAASGKIDLVWHLGDIGYADDDFVSGFGYLQDHYEDVYNTFMNEIEATAAVVPYMTLPGNHEAECHSPACQLDKAKQTAYGNFTAYEARFRMPGSESGGNTNMWSSFDYGPIHWISLDTETNYPDAPNDTYRLDGKNGDFWGDQLAWLEVDLQKAVANRGTRPWIMAGGHRPVYALNSHDEDGNPTDSKATVQAAFEGLFHKYGVDVFWAGHEHSYERQFPVWDGVNVYKSYDDAPYTAYMIVGSAGNPEDATPLEGLTAEWNAAWDDSHIGIGLLTILSPSHLRWEQYDAASGQVVDSFDMTKTL